MRSVAPLFFACVACRSPTQITLVVTTDLECSKVTGTSIAVGRLGELADKPAASTTAYCDRSSGRIGTLVVVPSGDRGEEVALRVVSGVGKGVEACTLAPGDTCVVARRALRFIPHKELVLNVAMRSACIGKPCAKDETCVQGNCVKAAVGDPEACLGAGCDETTLLPSGDAGVDGSDSIAPASGWTAIAPPPSALAARVDQTAIWTGTEMIVWGGNAGAIYFNDGASYDPSTNTWTMLPDSSLGPRSGHSAVWTGREMIVWGGADDSASAGDGAAYDPKTRTWTALPAAPVAERSGHGAVYASTTGEMIVWGGLGVGWLADGAAFAPAPTSTWRKLEASPLAGRERPGVAWDGTRMVVFGGASSSVFSDSATYDPKAKSWGTLPAVTIDARVPAVSVAIPPALTTVAFFGSLVAPEKDDGVAWNGSSWKPLVAPPSALPPPGRFGTGGFASSGRLWIWGGIVSAGAFLGNGASYDFASGAWAPMPAAPLSGRAKPSAVWTGTFAILWGGTNGTPLRDGAIFRP